MKQVVIKFFSVRKHIALQAQLCALLVGFVVAASVCAEINYGLCVFSRQFVDNLWAKSFLFKQRCGSVLGGLVDSVGAED